MSVSRLAAAIAITAAVAPAAAAQPADRSAGILAAARQALGGDAKLSGVKTIVATGRTQQVRGDNLVPIEFEIDCELPDKYVRVDEIPAQESGLTTAGFSADQLIQIPTPAKPLTPDAQKARTLALKQDFARLSLAWFAASTDVYPVTFAFAGQAEAPEGKADVMDVRPQSGLPMRLFVNSDTHLPLMISWQTPAREGQAPVETRLYFADYRNVDGVQWPFRIRRAVGGATVEETVFDRYKVNVKIDPRRFGGAR